jgi:hypothetical protein
VVIHPARGEVHELDEVGSFLWRAADGERTLEEIGAQVAEQFEVEAVRAAGDAREFYDKLESLGLLECRS